MTVKRLRATVRKTKTTVLRLFCFFKLSQLTKNFSRENDGHNDPTITATPLNRSPKSVKPGPIFLCTTTKSVHDCASVHYDLNVCSQRYSKQYSKYSMLTEYFLNVLQFINIVDFN